MAKTVFGKTAARAALSIATVLLLTLSFNSCNKDKNKKQEAPTKVFTIDGIKKQIVKAILNKTELEKDNYDIYLYINKDEYVNIELKKADDGKNIDLTKDDTEGWAVQYTTKEENIFLAIPKNSDYVLFLSGNLYVKRAGETMEFEVKLENGKIKDDKNGTNKEHTVSLYYKGNLELVEE